MDSVTADVEDLSCLCVTLTVGLLQRDSLVLLADRRAVYGSGAVHDNHRKLFGGDAAVGVAVAGATDTGEACVAAIELPEQAGRVEMQRLLGDVRAAFEDLVPAAERDKRMFDLLVGGVEKMPTGKLRPRLWSAGVSSSSITPCTIGVACGGVAASFALALGGQLHRPDLSPQAAIGLGAFLIEAASRCYASVGGGMDYLVFDPEGDPLQQPKLEPSSVEEASGRLDLLLTAWPDAQS
jgi:20S proteasome alpha/beta subunit